MYFLLFGQAPFTKTLLTRYSPNKEQLDRIRGILLGLQSVTRWTIAFAFSMLRLTRSQHSMTIPPTVSPPPVLVLWR